MSNLSIALVMAVPVRLFVQGTGFQFILEWLLVAVRTSTWC